MNKPGWGRFSWASPPLWTRLLLPPWSEECARPTLRRGIPLSGLGEARLKRFWGHICAESSPLEGDAHSSLHGVLLPRNLPPALLSPSRRHPHPSTGGGAAEAAGRRLLDPEPSPLDLSARAGLDTLQSAPINPQRAAITYQDAMCLLAAPIKRRARKSRGEGGESRGKWGCVRGRDTWARDARLQVAGKCTRQRLHRELLPPFLTRRTPGPMAHGSASGPRLAGGKSASRAVSSTTLRQVPAPCRPQVR